MYRNVSELALELTSRATCQVLERRHHYRGPNTGSLAPGIRQRAKKNNDIEMPSYLINTHVLEGLIDYRLGFHLKIFEH